jgi:hypothetical protein
VPGAIAEMIVEVSSLNPEDTAKLIIEPERRGHLMGSDFNNLKS